MKVNIGIPEDKRKIIAEGLSKLLADTYTLFLKTHNFHWNVTGPHFPSLHTTFEAQYQELFLAADAIAERIRSLGFFAPGSYHEFGSLTAVKEATGILKAETMVEQLVEGHETVARTARSIFPAGEAGSDEATLDLLTERIQTHEKTAWMLRSFLDR